MHRTIAIVTLSLTLLVVGTACGVCNALTQSAPAIATSAAGKVATTATTVAKPTASPTVAATAKPSSSAPSVADIIAKARATTEYSCDYAMTGAAGGEVKGKLYVKGDKMRQDMKAGGLDTYMIIDSRAKVAYSVMPAQKMAIKIDMSSLGQTTRPNDSAAGMPADARFVGLDTVDGKPAAVFEYANSGTPVKSWTWIERGLPLKAEVTAGGARMTSLYSNYQIGGVADTLFEIPKDFTVQ